MLWWTIQTLIGAAALCAIVWCLCKAFRLGPVARHALWVLVLLKLLTPPVVEWPWSVANPFEKPVTNVVAPMARVEIPTSVAPRPIDNAVVMKIETAPAPAKVTHPIRETATNAPAAPRVVAVAPAPPKPWLTLALCLKFAGWTWLAGSTLFALIQLVRILEMLIRIRRGSEPSERLLKRVHELGERLGVRNVRTIIVPGIGSPMIWSLHRPILLWPAEFPADMSVVSVRGLILHELAHVKRKDHWVGWLELIAGCIWWWNPLFWYVRHRLREDAELACDAWVVQSLPGGRRAYASGLLAVCECIQGTWKGEPNSSKPSVSMAAVGIATGGRRFLERRLVMVMREKTNLRLGVLGLLATLLLGLIAAPAWPQKPPEGAPADPAPAADKHPEKTTAFEKTLIERLRERRAAEHAAELANERERHNYQRTRFLGGGLQPAAPLPEDAQKVMDVHRVETAALRQKFEADMKQKLDSTVAALTALQEKYTKDGKTAEALAVKQHIDALRGGGAAMHGIDFLGGPRRADWIAANAVLDEGLNLQQYRGQPQKILTVELTGQLGGTVWGSGVYTDDSSPATAAVHAGILRPGQKGMVKITTLPGQPAYQGSTANGVTTSDYGPWHGSFKIERAADAAAGAADAHANGTPQKPLAAPKSMGMYAEFIGQSFVFEVTGNKDGEIWGSGEYTEDSPLATAAVHAGIVEHGKKGIVHVTILPVRETFEGSTSNGVTSKAYGKVGQMSYRIERPDHDLAPGAAHRLLAGATFRDLMGLAPALQVGGSFEVEILGATDGVVWGSGVYTDDSAVGAAAVHAGIVTEGTRAKVKLTLLPGQQSYEGSTQNGITTRPYGPWTRSFKIEKVEAKP